MTRRSVLRGLAGLLLVTGLAASRGSGPAIAGPQTDGGPTLTVLAASSLTESLQKVAAAWTARGNPPVSFSFDASSRLAKQVESGAPVDAFFSADAEWMDHLEQRGLIDKVTRRDLLGNSLVVVLPAGSRLAVAAASDLRDPAIRHLALAGENVPAGRYARAALGSLGAWAAVEGRVVSGDNVRTVLGWVATGEAEAGVVYATDAKVEPRVRVAFTFPPSSHPRVVYPMAVTSSSAHPAEASSLLDYCRGAEGMRIFLAAGFSQAPEAPR